MTQATEAAKQPRHKRKILFIKKEFQAKFILKFCLIILFGAIVSTLILYLFSQGTVTTSFQHSRLVVRNTGSAILPAVIYTNLITLAMISVAAIMVTLYISHKIAGPLFRFERDLEEVSAGNLTKRIRLRGKDQMVEMADILNKMVEGLHQRMVGFRDDLVNVRDEAAKAKASDEVLKRLEELKERLERRFTL